MGVWQGVTKIEKQLSTAEISDFKTGRPKKSSENEGKSREKKI